MRRQLLLFLMLPLCAFANPKTDIVHLVNGNILNVELRSMSMAYMSVDTDSMGTINVKWPDVIYISSPHNYVVEDSTGGRFYGSLSTAEDRILQIIGADGTHAMPFSSVVSVYPSSRSMWRRFEGSVDGGYSFTKSDSRSDFNLSGELAYRSFQWETQLNVESDFSRSNGRTDTDRDAIGFSAMRHLGSRWNALTFAQYQHNLELGLSYRNSILGGVARRLVQTNRTTFTVMGGAAYAYENYTDIGPKSSVEAGLGARYEFYKLYSPKIDISIQFLVTPSLTISNRVRTELQADTKFELIKDFFWTVSFYDSYDSKPPGQQNQNQKQDYGFSTGVGWTFR